MARNLLLVFSLAVFVAADVLCSLSDASFSFNSTAPSPVLVIGSCSPFQPLFAELDKLYLPPLPKGSPVPWHCLLSFLMSVSVLTHVP